MQYDTILLDIDGTLLDSNAAHAAAWHDAFLAAGYSVDRDVLRPLIGMGGDKIVPQLAPGLSVEHGAGKSIAEAVQKFFDERYLAGLKATPGARALLLALREQGLQLVIASSAKPEEMDPLLAAAGVADLISLKADSAGSTPSKPDPDIIESALKRAGARAEKTLMIGDTRFDVEAAARAKVPTIGLRCGGSSDSDLAGAVAIYDDPADLLTHFALSPLGRG